MVPEYSTGGFYSNTGTIVRSVELEGGYSVEGPSNIDHSNGYNNNGYTHYSNNNGHGNIISNSFDNKYDKKLNLHHYTSINGATSNIFGGRNLFNDGYNKGTDFVSSNGRGLNGYEQNENGHGFNGFRINGQGLSGHGSNGQGLNVHGENGQELNEYRFTNDHSISNYKNILTSGTGYEPKFNEDHEINNIIDSGLETGFGTTGFSEASKEPFSNSYKNEIGSTVPATVHKHIYVHEAPPDEEEVRSQRPIQVPQPQKHYKIIFVKLPTVPTPTLPTIPVIPQNEEKTLVYVLVKKPEEAPEIVIPTPPPTAPSKPEVYFIRYKAPKQPYRNGDVNGISGEGTTGSFTPVRDTSFPSKEINGGTFGSNASPSPAYGPPKQNAGTY